MVLDTDAEGVVFPKSQVMDYRCHGDGLVEYNLLDFIVHTYEEDATKSDGDVRNGAEERHEQVRGRPCNRRIPYLQTHPKSNKCYRVRRTEGHNNLPDVVGRWFPRRDDEDRQDYYMASMLMLLKPWRSLVTDLKDAEESWSVAFHKFTKDAPPQVHTTFSAIQYFHECDTAAKQTTVRDANENATVVADDGPENMDLPEPSAEEEEGVTEESLAALIASKKSWKEELHGRMAVEIAKNAHFFEDCNDQWDATASGEAARASQQQVLQLKTWNAQMREEVENEDGQRDRTWGGVINAAGPTVQPLSPQPDVDVDRPRTRDGVLQPLTVPSLESDQERAFEIIVWHFEETLAGHRPPPLRMILYGEGGTGKSKVIQTVTQAMTTRHARHLLIKSAYTGIAASLIEGKTTHHICQLSVGTNGKMSAERRNKLQLFWKHYRYLVIDEFSMIGKSFLALLSRNVCIGKADENVEHSFGGVNVVLCGDLHQFPPVATRRNEALFRPREPSDSIDVALGRKIYEEFTTVVVLKQQKRVTDPVWCDFLQQLRMGQVRESHLAMLRGLIMGSPQRKPNELTSPEWRSAPLVTPRHAVREQWNSVAVRKECKRSGRTLYVIQAEDTVRGRAVTLPERLGLALRKKRSGKEVPEKVEIAIGTKIIVTSNVATDLDITNGASGEIFDICLDPREPVKETRSTPMVVLQYLPIYVLVRFDRTRAKQLPGLPQGVLPLEAARTALQVRVRTGDVEVTKTIQRRQFPLTAGYAITDYRSQGQTIPYVLVDITSPPPPGTLSLFNLYVALSRSSGRQTIRLLRDFDDELFLQTHDPHLILEDARLKDLDTETTIWWQGVREGGEEDASGNHPQWGGGQHPSTESSRRGVRNP